MNKLIIIGPMESHDRWIARTKAELAEQAIKVARIEYEIKVLETCRRAGVDVATWMAISNQLKLER